MRTKWNHAWLLTATLALGAQTAPGLQQSQVIRVGETSVEDEAMAKVIAPLANKIKGPLVFQIGLGGVVLGRMDFVVRQGRVMASSGFALPINAPAQA